MFTLESDFPSNYTCHGINDIGEQTYELKLEKAAVPKSLRNIEIVKRGITKTSIQFQRDYSEGQIDISDVIVTLEAKNRPVKGMFRLKAWVLS